jgi:hypothetical protein
MNKGVNDLKPLLISKRQDERLCHQFSLRLTSKQKAKLHQLSLNYGVDMGAILRGLIESFEASNIDEIRKVFIANSGTIEHPLIAKVDTLIELFKQDKTKEQTLNSIDQNSEDSVSSKLDLIQQGISNLLEQKSKPTPPSFSLPSLEGLKSLVSFASKNTSCDVDSPLKRFLISINQTQTNPTSPSFLYYRCTVFEEEDNLNDPEIKFKYAHFIGILFNPSWESELIPINKDPFHLNNWWRSGCRGHWYCISEMKPQSLERFTQALYFCLYGAERGVIDELLKGLDFRPIDTNMNSFAKSDHQATFFGARGGNLLYSDLEPK